jgi:hypothetical protein
MGIHRGPNPVNDGLVFGYDTGYGVANNTTPTRFYPGKSTTNLLTSSGAQSLDVKSDIYNNVTKTDLGNGKYRFVNDGTGSTTVRVLANVNNLVNGQYYGCSVSYEELNAGGYIHLDWCDTTNTTFTQASYGSANRIHIYGARSAYDSTYRFFDISLPVNGSVVLFDAQIESGIPSPFVNGTRSSTASLIDLKKTTDIDVSNVSFDSTGQPSFDETDDHITGVLPMNGLGAPHTIEIVFSCNVNQGSIGSRKDPFSIGNSTTHQYSALDVNSSNMNWYFYSRDTTFTNSPLMVAGKYYHMVFSYAGGASNNTNKKVWMNNIQQTLSSGSSETPLLPNNPSFSVGRDRGRNTAYWPGDIPVFKVYDRALSAAEVKQSYNAYKNRFDI